jgi:hypothetical protein
MILMTDTPTSSPELESKLGLLGLVFTVFLFFMFTLIALGRLPLLPQLPKSLSPQPTPQTSHPGTTPLPGTCLTHPNLAPEKYYYLTPTGTNIQLSEFDPTTETICRYTVYSSSSNQLSNPHFSHTTNSLSFITTSPDRLNQFVLIKLSDMSVIKTVLPTQNIEGLNTHYTSQPNDTPQAIAHEITLVAPLVCQKGSTNCPTSSSPEITTDTYYTVVSTTGNIYKIDLNKLSSNTPLDNVVIENGKINFYDSFKKIITAIDIQSL